MGVLPRPNRIFIGLNNRAVPGRKRPMASRIGATHHPQMLIGRAVFLPLGCEDRCSKQERHRKQAKRMECESSQLPQTPKPGTATKRTAGHGVSLSKTRAKRETKVTNKPRLGHTLSLPYAGSMAARDNPVSPEHSSPTAWKVLVEQLRSADCLDPSYAANRTSASENWATLPSRPALHADLSLPFLKANGLWPLAAEAHSLKLGVTDATQGPAIVTLSRALGRRVWPVPITAQALHNAIKAYQADDHESQATNELQRLLTTALNQNASDLHLEPAQDALHIRLRQDGVLRPLENIPHAEAQALINRLKVLANLDVTEHRLPQDGRLSFLGKNGEELSVRVSILPTRHGEAAALRLPAAEARKRPLSALGFDAACLAALAEWCRAPHGLFLVTGPTGSGKTTTLYALLQALATTAHKCVSLEDPIEATLAGVVQTQVQSAIGLTFAAGLRALLRHDPDVIMIGEIRDAETARIAIEAALTGHKVLSSLHTGTAAGAVARLRAMGVESWALADALMGVLNQRLLRRNAEENDETLTGGRQAVGALFTVTPALRRLIRAGGEEEAMTALAGGDQTAILRAATAHAPEGVSAEEIARALAA